VHLFVEEHHGSCLNIRRRRFTDREDGSFRFVVEEEASSNRRQVTGLRHLPVQNEQARSTDDTQDLPPSAGQEHVQMPALSVLRLCTTAAAPTHPHTRPSVNTQRRRRVWKWRAEEKRSGDEGGPVPLLDLSARRTKSQRRHLPPPVSPRSTDGALPLPRVSVLGRRQAHVGPASESASRSDGGDPAERAGLDGGSPPAAGRRRERVSDD